MLSYYDIDDILLEGELISAVFQVGANGVGLLDPSAETNAIEKSAKVDLPFWLAHELYLRQAVSINVPACFSLKTRREIQADAACVDLKLRSPYFYELGCKVLPLVSDKSIGPFLKYAFTSRYKEILSKSHGSIWTAPKFSSKLTKEESQSTVQYFLRVSGASVIGREKECRKDGASVIGREEEGDARWVELLLEAYWASVGSASGWRWGVADCFPFVFFRNRESGENREGCDCLLQYEGIGPGREGKLEKIEDYMKIEN